MTRTRIIENLFNGKNFTQCIEKMEPQHLRDDLRQEVMLVVCELPEQKLIDLYDRKQLDFFVVRIILNQIQSKTSPFFKKYRRNFIELTFDLPDNAVPPQEIEHTEQTIMKGLDKLYWYNAELVRIYLRVGNYRAMEKETGINYGSCYLTVKQSLRELRGMIEPAARVVPMNREVRKQVSI